MQERGSEPDGHRRKARAKAIAAPRRRKQGNAARAFDIVSLAVAIWLGVLVAAEGVQKLSEMTPASDAFSTVPTLQQVTPIGPVR